MAKRIETLEEKRDRLNAEHKKKLDQVNAQLKDAKARERTKERKRDTRRKIIIGGLVQKHITANPQSEMARKVVSLIEEYVTGDTERALFDLDPLPKKE